MASKRYNIIFDDGTEYETTIYEGGGLCIKSDYGGKILELGQYQMLDVLRILDSIRDELKPVEKGYDNPIVKKEEDERMELNESEICDTMAKTIVDFIDDEFTGWTDDEKAVMKRLLMSFCDALRLNLVDTECKKLDGMVGE